MHVVFATVVEMASDLGKAGVMSHSDWRNCGVREAVAKRGDCRLRRKLQRSLRINDQSRHLLFGNSFARYNPDQFMTDSM